MNKLLMTVASLAIVAAPLAASAQSFDHNRGGGGWTQGSGGQRQEGRDRGAYGRDHDRGDYGRGWNNRDNGSAIAAGLAGLFLGAALTSSQSYDYGQSYGYSQPHAYDQGYGYNQGYGYGCGWQTQAFRGRYGNVEYRQVNTCR